MGLTAGLLKDRVKIRRHTNVPNVAFGLNELYDVGLDRWARLQQISAATYYGAKQVGENVTHWIELRRATGTQPEDLTTDFVVEFKGRRYRVVRSRVHPDDDQFTAIEALDLGAI